MGGRGTLNEQAAAPAQVRRRHVLYVPGYDPRSALTYYRLFRRELAIWGKQNNCRVSVGRSGVEPDELHTWIMEAASEDWTTETRLDFCGWDDISRRDFATGYLSRVIPSFEAFAFLMMSGLYFDIIRWNWKFAAITIYPFLAALGYFTVAGLWTALCLGVGRHAGGGWLLLGFVAAAVGLRTWWRLIRRWEPHAYVFYLLNDLIWTVRHSRRMDARSAERFERYARRLADVAQAGDADEYLVVGHSSGSFIGAEVVARALELAPRLGVDGPPLGFLTVGANTVIACGGRQDNMARRAISKLLSDARVRWFEYYTPNDVLSFPRLNYRKCYRVELEASEQINPTMRSARMAEIFSRETWGRLAWRFFDKHFQFLRANDYPGEYDFYRFLVGPERFGEARF